MSAPEVVQAQVVRPDEFRPRALARNSIQLLAARLGQAWGVSPKLVSGLGAVVDAKLEEWGVPESITPVEAARRLGVLKPEGKGKR